MTVVFITHEMDEALTLGDRIVLLRTGAQIAQQGTPQEFLTEPADDFVREFLGLDRGQRTLTPHPGPNGSVLLVDSHGRPAGLLEGQAP